MLWLWIWSIACAIIAVLFLTVITLEGAPMDEWILFAILGIVPWFARWVWFRS